MITAGGGYTAGNTYNITSTNGSGTGGSIKILTVSDTGTSIGKLACVANESASPLVPECGILTTNGISVRLSGTSAKAHLLYE